MLTARNTFLELPTSRVSGASMRKTRSEGPQARMISLPRHVLGSRVGHPDDDANFCTRHSIFDDCLGRSVEASDAEPIACPTPWSSLCGDWGYQGDAWQLELTTVETACPICNQVVIGGSTEAGTPWSGVRGVWDYQSAPSFELEAVPGHGDDGEMSAPLHGYPGIIAAQSLWAEQGTVECAAQKSSIVEDRGGQLVSATPPKADSYLAALMRFAGATPQPCGGTHAIQTASRASAAHRATGRQTSKRSDAKTLASASVREGAAEAIRDEKMVTKGRRRSGVLGGRRRRASTEASLA